MALGQPYILQLAFRIFIYRADKALQSSIKESFYGRLPSTEKFLPATHFGDPKDNNGEILAGAMPSL
jgi:hypothetical protein